jgi:3-deoxy-D-manno-octulosonate 8-phosphate phosphatase (KDO 8-P phosphatase)
MIDPAIAKRIRLVGFDVDGVLTDAGVYTGMAGTEAVELKRFDIQDGVGVRLLRESGLKTAMVSGRISRATALRAAELEIDEVFQDDAAQKLPAFEEILARQGVSWDEVAFVGDDLPDLPLLTRVGLPVAVRNAVPEVRDAAHHITDAAGGRGAVREFIEQLLRARGEWDAAVERYVSARGGVPKVSNVS